MTTPPAPGPSPAPIDPNTIEAELNLEGALTRLQLGILSERVLTPAEIRTLATALLRSAESSSPTPREASD